MTKIKVTIEIIETKTAEVKKVSLFDQIRNEVETFNKKKKETLQTMVDNVRQLNPIANKILSELNEYVGLEFFNKNKNIETTMIGKNGEVFSGIQLSIPSMYYRSPWSGIYIGFKGQTIKEKHGEFVNYDYSEVKIYFRIDVSNHETNSGYIFDFDLGKINSICDPLYKAEIKRVLSNQN